MTTPGNSIWEQELRASVDAMLTEQLRNLQGRVELRLRQAIHESLDEAVRETIPPLAQGVGNRIDQWSARASRSRIVSQSADSWPEWLGLLLAATRPAEALQSLLYAVTSVSGRAAIFILRGGQASIWRSSAGIKLPESLAVRDHELLRRCMEQPQRMVWTAGEPPLAPFPPGLGNAASGGLHPLRVHAKTIGFLYWEQDEAGDSTQAQRFDLLVQLTGLILQTLTPALNRPAAAPAAAAEEPAAPTAETAPATPPAPIQAPPSSEAPATPAAPPAAVAAVPSPSPAPAPAPARSALTPLEARAQRFAKVLIQDLEIYLHRDRPGVLAAAREERNVYGRLRDELERARKSFWEKFPPASGVGAEVLEEAVILLLCDADPTLMGPDYPGLKPYL